MTERPTQVRVGHLRYRVIWDSAEIDKASVENRVNYAGYSNATKGIISVRPDMPVDYTADTLLHEILHQCLRASGVDPDQDADANLKDVEERAVAAIAGPLLATLRDNPDVVAFLLDDGETPVVSLVRGAG